MTEGEARKEPLICLNKDWHLVTEKQQARVV